MEKSTEKVFHFYSKQQALLGKTPTFDMIQNNLNTFTKGKFLKFCLDFAVPFTTRQVLEIFLKISENSQQMSLDQFRKALHYMKGENSYEEFCEKISLNDPKKCLEKCKPFSKKNAISLPKLSIPRRIIEKKVASTTVSQKSTQKSSSSKRTNKVILVKKKIQNNSYQRLNRQKVSWDILNKFPHKNPGGMYTEICVENESDDEVLKKFGYF